MPGGTELPIALVLDAEILLLLLLLLLLISNAAAAAAAAGLRYIASASGVAIAGR